jgi:hypothetical protein
MALKRAGQEDRKTPENVECKVINLPPINRKFLMEKQGNRNRRFGQKSVCLNIFIDIILFSL